MQNLKPCPCGQIPKSVSIADNGSKWAYVSGDCCSEWSVEFRTQYHRIDTDECMALAVEAWNEAGRSSLLTPRALDSALVCAKCEHPKESHWHRSCGGGAYEYADCGGIDDNTCDCKKYSIVPPSQ